RLRLAYRLSIQNPFGSAGRFSRMPDPPCIAFCRQERWSTPPTSWQNGIRALRPDTAARLRHLSYGGPAFHRPANRAGDELRESSCHRDRERAAAQRAARSNGRAERVVGAADGDL